METIGIPTSFIGNSIKVNKNNIIRGSNNFSDDRLSEEDKEPNSDSLENDSKLN